jgi:hypothetical protein
LRDVYKLQFDLDQQAKEEKLISEYEKKIENYPVALLPLGVDGQGREYFIFPEEEAGNRVYIRYKRQRDAFGLGKSSSSTSSSSSAGGVTDMEQEGRDDNVAGGFKEGAAFDEIKSSTITNVVRSTLKSSIDPHISETLNSAFNNPNGSLEADHTWGYYGSNQDIYDLIQNLDAKIECESDLKARLKSRFDVKEPDENSIYLRTGQDSAKYLGRRVIRFFDKSKIPVFGTVIGWVPGSNNSAAQTSANNNSSSSVVVVVVVVVLVVVVVVVVRRK